MNNKIEALLILDTETGRKNKNCWFFLTCHLPVNYDGVCLIYTVPPTHTHYHFSLSVFVCSYSVQRSRRETEICTRSTEWGATEKNRRAARSSGGGTKVSRTEGGGTSTPHRGDTCAGYREATSGGGAQEGHHWGREGATWIYSQKESGKFSHMKAFPNFPMTHALSHSFFHCLYRNANRE